MHDLQKIVAAEKSLSVFPGWSKPESETQYLVFDAPIEIEGVTETGLVLHGGCFRDRPNCNVSFELRIAKSPGRRCIPIERFDWLSLNGGHSNPRRNGHPLSGLILPPTHLHAFEHNYSEAEHKMRAGNLRMAQEVDPEPQDFDSVREFVGKRLRINNIDLVHEPDWQYDLFGGMF